MLFRSPPHPGDQDQVCSTQPCHISDRVNERTRYSACNFHPAIANNASDTLYGQGICSSYQLSRYVVCQVSIERIRIFSKTRPFFPDLNILYITPHQMSISYIKAEQYSFAEFINMLSGRYFSQNKNLGNSSEV